MAKIILEFDSIDEADLAREALDGTKWKSAMWTLDQRLRSTTKYGASILNSTKEASVEECEICTKVREIIRETLLSNSLDLE